MTDDERTQLGKRVAANAQAVVASEQRRELETAGEILRSVRQAALKATGLSGEELDAMAAMAAEEPVHAGPDARTIARGRLRRAGAPRRHIEHVVDQEPDECDALRAVRAFMGDPKAWCLVLSGGVGTQKTGSCCWALKHEEGGMFVEADELLAIALEDKPRYLRLKRAHLVVLDDLGCELRDPKGYWIKTFTTLMNGWYSACARVLITCNVSSDFFKQRIEDGGYGERVADRIREHGRFVEIAGESVRRRLP